MRKLAYIALAFTPLALTATPASAVNCTPSCRCTPVWTCNDGGNQATQQGCHYVYVDKC